MDFYLVGVASVIAAKVVTENAIQKHQKVVDNNYAVYFFHHYYSFNLRMYTCAGTTKRVWWRPPFHI